MIRISVVLQKHAVQTILAAYLCLTFLDLPIFDELLPLVQSLQTMLNIKVKVTYQGQKLIHYKDGRGSLYY